MLAAATWSVGATSTDVNWQQQQQQQQLQQLLRHLKKLLWEQIICVKIRTRKNFLIKHFSPCNKFCTILPRPLLINVFALRFIVRRWLRDLCTYGEYRKAFLIVATVWLGVGICSYGIHFSQG